MQKRYLKWVCGGVDFNGVVVGHAYWSDDDETVAHHTKEEKATGCTWRMDGNHKELMSNFIPQPRQLTEEEIFKIEDWLVKNGFLKENEELHEAGTIRYHKNRKTVDN